MKLSEGTTIKERYSIRSKIGEGGFASVYCAYDSLLNRHVAVKVLKFVTEEQSSARFFREAKLLAKLSHKNIVAVFAFDILDDSTPIIVMEYLQGSSLQRLLSDKGNIDPDLLLRILTQCCEGLAYLHKCSIIHRDLSPANIFLIGDDNDITVKLLDFGLSKAAIAGSNSVFTSTGLIMGNPPYISPETISGEHVDSRSDIYSLGCILYECLTEQRAFDADTPMGILYKQEHSYPDEPSLNTEQNQTGKLLSYIALRCLQKSPNKRFQSCEEILDLISQCASGNNTVLEVVSLDSWGNGSKQSVRLKLGGATIPSVVLISILLVVAAMSIAMFIKLQNDSSSAKKMRSIARRASGSRVDILIAKYNKNPDDMKSLSDLATYYMGSHDHAAAKPYLNRLIALQKEAFVRDSPALVPAQALLAVVYQSENNNQAVVDLSLQSLAILDKASITESQQYCQILERAAGALQTLRRYKEATSLFKRSITLEEKYSPRNPDLVNSITNLGQCYFESGNKTEAEACYQRAISLGNKILDKESPSMDWPMMGLATVRFEEGNYSEAEALTKQVLAWREKRANTNHLPGLFPLEGYVSGGLEFLARIYTKSGRTKDATPILERDVSICKRIFAEDRDGSLTRSLTALADNYESLGRKQEAADVMKQVKVISQKKDATSNASTNVNVAGGTKK